MKIMAAALFTLVLCAGAALAWGATAWVLWEHEEVESYSQGRDNGDKWKLHDAAETYTEREAMLRATWKTKSDLLKTIEKFGYSIASQPGFISVLSVRQNRFNK